MRKGVLVILFIILSSAVFADETSDELTKSRAYYWKAQYGAAVRSGLKGMDLMYKKMLETIFNYIPELGGYKVVQSNYTYSFSGDNGYTEAFFQLEKVMSNDTAVIKVLFDNSQSEVERYYSLFKSYEFLSDKGNYDKRELKVQVSKWTTKNYEYLWHKWQNTAFFVFPFDNKGDADVDMIESGLLMRVSFQFLDSKFSYKDQQKLIQWYFDEMFKSLKISTLEYYLK